ncbi:RsmB/NOP family class I SAM-dependent RNA methyltransferase [Marimonas sp. MJW-29]|uniref:RsmB/NOP family class I SAM-dependent RNA methyltransferase n=1 Tax=Sulfitobacter sediminis TaxID=3234186 RepID=A0ABV3RSL6_9RHOB
MTPGARVAAAIEVLTDMAEGAAAEQALTRWARRSRFAGSKDRAAVRDHVFDVLRRRRLAAHHGGDEGPRNLMIGLLHLQGEILGDLFSGEGHAPSPLGKAEAPLVSEPTDRAVAWNLPDWLVPKFEESLGENAEAAALALTERAPVTLRINTGKTTRSDAMHLLASEGVETRENRLCATALTVTKGARKIRNTKAFLDGLVELQDAASQAVVAALPAGGRVLDYCAGGGGKALALAADPARDVFAHDVDPGRMQDLAPRAARAGVRISEVQGPALKREAPFDTVLCDAPCSGSGAWRRAPEGKWTLSPERLAELTTIQDGILDEAVELVTFDGLLAYATCSVLRDENEARIAAFLERHTDWRQVFERRFHVGPEGDGFYTAHLIRAS